MYFYWVIDVWNESFVKTPVINTRRWKEEGILALSLDVTRWYKDLFNQFQKLNQPQDLASCVSVFSSHSQQEEGRVAVLVTFLRQSFTNQDTPAALYFVVLTEVWALHLLYWKARGPLRGQMLLAISIAYSKAMANNMNQNLNTLFKFINSACFCLTPSNVFQAM